MVERRRHFTVKLPHTIAEAGEAASKGCPFFTIVCTNIIEALFRWELVLPPQKSLPPRLTLNLKRIPYILLHLCRASLYLHFDWSESRKCFNLTVAFFGQPRSMRIYGQVYDTQLSVMAVPGECVLPLESIS
jgi:hypothetical protein